MVRQDRIEKGYRKVKKAIEKLTASRSMDYTQEVVKITDKLNLEVKCQRKDLVVYEEDMGKAYGFEVYAIKDGKDIDCVSDHGNLDEDIKWMLNCYL